MTDQLRELMSTFEVYQIYVKAILFGILLQNTINYITCETISC